MKYLKAFALAWNMLTIVPFMKVHDFFKGINGLSAMFYPLVGFLLGSVLYGAYMVFSSFFPPLQSGVAVFTLWVVLTGALHLDGFSDTVDGLFVPKEKALAVMKESHVGGMGMLFSVVFLIFKASLFVGIENTLFLPLVLALARLNAVVAMYSFEYISSGVGQLVKEELSKPLVVFAVVYVGAIALMMDGIWLMIPALIFGLLAATLFRRRYGGLSGDLYGFIIETSELFLLALLVAAHT